jgi:hypothetical protein
VDWFLPRRKSARPELDRDDTPPAVLTNIADYREVTAVTTLRMNIHPALISGPVVHQQ